MQLKPWLNNHNLKKNKYRKTLINKMTLKMMINKHNRNSQINNNYNKYMKFYRRYKIINNLTYNKKQASKKPNNKIKISNKFLLIKKISQIKIMKYKILINSKKLKIKWDNLTNRLYKLMRELNWRSNTQIKILTLMIYKSNRR